MKLRVMRSGLLASLVVLALVWTTESSRYALRSTRDCDVFREWVVGQYIIQRVDPWRVGLETLRLNYGSMRSDNPPKPSRMHIYEIHPSLKTDGIEGIMPQWGPPTATYIPSNMLLFTLFVGFLPQPMLVPLWLTVNLIALILLARLLHSWLSSLSPPTDATPEHEGSLAFPSWLWISIILFLWPPSQEVLRTNQFVPLIVIFLLLAFRYMGRNDWLSGVFFSLAMLKPHIALPFLVIPLVQYRWRVFVVIAATQILALLGISVWLRTSPVTLMTTWLEITLYMFQGAYTIQEFINALDLANSTGTVIKLLFAALCTAWCFATRKASVVWHIAFLAFACVFWTYHERYDYMILVLPLLAMMAVGKPGKSQGLIELGFFVLAFALSDYAYLHDTGPAHVIRWGGRLSEYSLLVYFAIRLLRERPGYSKVLARQVTSEIAGTPSKS